MARPHLPLNALRAFEASARHLSFTRAGLELRVTQAAVSHQVKGLEEMLGVTLFRRLPRGLALTDEGLVLVPVLTEAFERIGSTLHRLEHGQIAEVVTVGCNSTFANGWLPQHLDEFRTRHPLIDLRLLINPQRLSALLKQLEKRLHAQESQNAMGADADSTPRRHSCAPSSRSGMTVSLAAGRGTGESGLMTAIGLLSQPNGCPCRNRLPRCDHDASSPRASRHRVCPAGLGLA
jgi:hypothetical protein